MKKFLFVADRFDTPLAGGTALSHSHHAILSNISEWGMGTIVSILSRKMKEKHEPNKISIRSERSKFGNIVNILTGKTTVNGMTYSIQAENEIVSLIKDDSYTFVWFDDCIFGSTIRKIKRIRPDLPVYVFYHVVLKYNLMSIMRENIFKLRGILTVRSSMNYIKQQKLSAHYADVNVLLNERDNETFSGLYGFNAQLTLPISFIDRANIIPVEKKPEEFNIFFIGMKMAQNFDGIKWFVTNVMPKLNSKAKLIIVGSVSDLCKDEPEFRDNPKISIMGRVDDLDPYYNMTDLVVVPILYGEGMMTKVAEAMMYGKNILSTSHALNGYPEIENQCRCDTPEEFITRINDMIENGTERFNPEMRRIFEEKYSIDAMTRTLREDFLKRGIL